MEHNTIKFEEVFIKESDVIELITLLPDNFNSLRNLSLRSLKEPKKIRGYLSLIRQLKSIADGTVFLLSFEVSIDQAKKALIAIMALLGNTIKVEINCEEFWYPLPVDLDSHPNAGGGIGENPPHIDMLTFSEFPNSMVILCERSDPMKGGRTLLSPLCCYKNLNQKYINVLKKASYSYWEDKSLEQIGEHLSQFSVLPSILNNKFRFTLKLIKWIEINKKEEDLSKNDQMKILSISSYHKLLQFNQAEFKLESNQALIFSQLRYAHGRTALGDSQFKIPVDMRRLLWRAYFNC